jgi:hypothetical protein
MTPGLDGVPDVTVIANLVVHGRVPRGRLAPLLLSRLGAPSPWTARAAIRGVTTASAHRLGVCAGVIPVGGGRRLGRPGERSAMSRSRTLGLLLESNVEKPLHLVQALVGLRVWCVGDVL